MLLYQISSFRLYSAPIVYQKKAHDNVKKLTVFDFIFSTKSQALGFFSLNLNA